MLAHVAKHIYMYNAHSLFFHYAEAGVPHIVDQVCSYIDVISLCALQLVCHGWNSTVADLPRWKHLIKNKLESNPVWKGLFDRRW